MIACVIGIIAPAPNPWRARKMMSAIIEWLCPQRADPITNRTIPTMKNRRRPKASDSLPQTGIDAAEASR